MAIGNQADELPLAVQGYRVDARQVQDGNADPTSTTPAWNSLVTVDVTLSALDGAFSVGPVSQELCVAPTPVSNAGSGNFWLPRYFAHWRGRSLVVNDQYAYAFSGDSGQNPKSYQQDLTAPQFSGTIQDPVPPKIGLRYGQWYQFRTRLSDLTGGGPTVDSTVSDAAEVVTDQFLRYVPPKTTKVELDNPISPLTITVHRPELNYPEMVFAGAAGSDPFSIEAELSNLLSQLDAAEKAGESMQVSLPDPDVVTLEIIVEAQAPAHDTGNAASMGDMGSPPNKGDLDGTFRVVYSYRVPFNGPCITLNIEAVQCSQITSLNAPPPPEGPPYPDTYFLTVPTERNLRIRIRSLGDGSLVGSYWGNTQGKVACTGLVTDRQVRYETPSSIQKIIVPPKPVIADGKIAQQLQAFYLREDPAASQQAVISAGVSQSLPSTTTPPPSSPGVGLQESLAASFQSPASDPIQRLAQALNLSVNGQTLTGQPGRRVLFGAQNTLRYSVTQDLSSITFSSLKDLIGHWIVAIQLTLDRDWTYSGVAQNGPGQTGFVFRERREPLLTSIEVGCINLPTVVSALATQPTGEDSQRDSTDIIFFATVDSTVAPGDFPDIIDTTWTLDATFTDAPTTSVRLWNGSLQLPVTLSPQQTPKLVSAGLAESPYKPDPDKYAFTEQRQRALWFEFESPPADPRDEYYYRVLGYGPDPLLMSLALGQRGNPELVSRFPAQIEPSLQIDPEWIRVIAAGDTNDDAGLSAMTKLIPAKAPLNESGEPVHYLVPLPNSLSPTSLELFGFWTIELRVGHGNEVWSTAQARYGRPLRVSGVQFPPPPLTVSVERIRFLLELPSWIVATASLAKTVYNGASLTSSIGRLTPTAIWFLLYAQVQRVDGMAWRNILIAKVLGKLVSSQDESNYNVNLQVEGRFSQSEIDSVLTRLLPNTRRPGNTPLSVLAVELLYKGGTASDPGVLDVDPLGSQLGINRILRVSPLTAVPDICS